jgi:hypothetical protein
MKRRVTLDASDYTVEDRGHTTPCWIAKTKKSNGRYALTRIDGREVYMHRAMYEQVVGAIPVGLQIDHLCRITRCIRPEHLESVTPATNIHRSRAAKLTEAQARRVRYGKEPISFLCSELGVSFGLLYQIRRGEIWKGV